MPDQGSVIPRRLLAAELKRLRQVADLTLDDLQRELLISTSKLSRLENAQGLPQLRDVRDLIRFYGLQGTTEAKTLEHWVEESRRPPWWSRVGSSLPAVTTEYLAFETAAATISAYASRYLPSLLHTRDYATALITALSEGPVADLDAQVTVRLARPDIVTRPERPVAVHFVVDESALLRRTGSNAVMRDGLLHAATFAESLPNVTLQVLPLVRGPIWATAGGSFSIFRFPQGTYPDVLHPEREKYIADSERVDTYWRGFEVVRRAALTPERSVSVLRDTAARYAAESDE